MSRRYAEGPVDRLKRVLKEHDITGRDLAQRFGDAEETVSRRINRGDWKDEDLLPILEMVDPTRVRELAAYVRYGILIDEPSGDGRRPIKEQREEQAAVIGMIDVLLELDHGKLTADKLQKLRKRLASRVRTARPDPEYHKLTQYLKRKERAAREEERDKQKNGTNE